MNRLYKICFLKILFPVYYKILTLASVKINSVLFIEVRLMKLSNNYELLDEYFKREEGFFVQYIFLGNEVVSKIQYVRNCLKMLKQLAVSNYVFLNESSNVVSCIKLRKETKLVQTWHGCGAFKKFGYCAPKTPKEPFYKNYSLVTVSSPEVIRAYEVSMKLKQNIVQPIGVSRTDIFFDKNKINLFIDNAQKVIPVIDKKIILYAPTFRDSIANAQLPVELNLEQMFQAFHTQYILLIKNHQAINERINIPDSCKNFAYDVTDKLTIEEAMCISDLCITDYSSLIFEYSLFEKPMLFFAYDYEQYFSDRGFYYEYKDIVPGPICRTTKELICCIEKISEYNIAKVIDFKDRFMSSCDGNATQRIVDYIRSDIIH